MAGKRRHTESGAAAEISGILLLIVSFSGLVWSCYQLGGLWLALIPAFVALMWIGYNRASGIAPPGGTPGGTQRDSRRDSTPNGEYRDPDATLPAGLYERDSRRDPVPLERDSQRD